MKKTITLLLVAFLLVGTLGFAIAEENTTEDNSTEVPDVNETDIPEVEDKVEEEFEEEIEEEIEVPEAKRTGFFKRLRFTFTFNKEKKIKRALEIAEEKLAYADSIAEENPERAEKIYAEYEEFIERAEDILAKIESRSNNEDESSKDIGKLVRIHEQFEKHQEQTDAIYNRALKRFEANNATPEKIERFEGFYERATERNENALAKALARRENALKKHKVLTEMSDDELEDLLENIEENEGIAKEREAREKRERKRIVEMKMVKEHSMERIMKNPNFNEEEKAQIRNAFAIIEQKAEQAKEMRQEKLESGEGVAEMRKEQLELHKENVEAVREKAKNVIEAELASRE